MKLKSLYLHFPFCRHLCNYCDFHKAVLVESNQLDQFNDKIKKSFHTHKIFLNTHGYEMGELETFYMGGGTPSLWGELGGQFLKSLFNEFGIFRSKNEHEFTLEVNPGAWSEKGLKSFVELGMNRFSLGVQSMDSRFIKHLDRIHSLDEVHKTLSYFNEKDLNFSVDFMLGLPFSKEYKRNIIFELEQILKYDPDHLSLYILTTKSNYIHKDHLPDDDWVSTEYMNVANFLKERGYDHYEVSNFAKKGKASKHNLMYWKSNGVGAIGPSATGLLPEKNLRYKWKNQSEEMMIEKLTDKELNLEKFYMFLRTNQGMDLNSSGPYFSLLNLCSNRWEEKGWGVIEDKKFFPSSLGFLMVDSMMDDVFKIC